MLWSTPTVYVTGTIVPEGVMLNIPCGSEITASFSTLEGLAVNSKCCVVGAAPPSTAVNSSSVESLESVVVGAVTLRLTGTVIVELVTLPEAVMVTVAL